MNKRNSKHYKQRGPQPTLFGFHAVREAWLNPERDVQALYLTPQSKNGFESVMKEARAKGLNRPSPNEVDKNEMDKLCPPGAVHQGLALLCKDLPETDLQDLIITSKTQERTLLVMLDQVTDPHNVGAIMRSACAFGIAGIVMQKKHAPDLKGVLAKTASGAAEHVPVAYETNLSRALEALQQEGFFSYGLDERGRQTIDQLANSTPPEKMVLVLGAEGPGIRKLVKEHCDELVRLPMEGPIPSLNVSNAAAVAFYALSQIKN